MPIFFQTGVIGTSPPTDGVAICYNTGTVAFVGQDDIGNTIDSTYSSCSRSYFLEGEKIEQLTQSTENIIPFGQLVTNDPDTFVEVDYDNYEFELQPTDYFVNIQVAIERISSTTEILRIRNITDATTVLAGEIGYDLNSYNTANVFQIVGEFTAVSGKRYGISVNPSNSGTDAQIVGFELIRQGH